MTFAQPEELSEFLDSNQDIELIEVLMPDFHGLLRCKRIQRSEFETLFNGGFSVPGTVPFLGLRGNLYDGLSQLLVGGDPDVSLRPIAGTLAPIPWYDAPIAQVLTGYVTEEGAYSWIDPRSPLRRVMQRYESSGLHSTVAPELEFYLIAPGDGDKPQPLVGKIPGTSLRQEGIQYCMPDDLHDCHRFLEQVRHACEVQGVPLTAIHSEFSAGQWEINTHHQSDAVVAGNHAALLKRIVKGVARQHGWGATFMAKPFAEQAGSGLHVHASVYNNSGENVFADPDPVSPPRLMPRLRHAVAGLGKTLHEGMAFFAPNPNSYRRFKAGAFAPAGSNWGYDHREASFRIPASCEQSRRLEHRVSGADANPYLVLAAVLAGVHHGLDNPEEPGPPIPREADLSDAPITLPKRLEFALEALRCGQVLPGYFGKDFTETFLRLRDGEADDYYAQIPDIDYKWMLRAL
ncbi:MAG: glutamine synthetase family protein [Pseudomonadota bacterium]